MTLSGEIETADIEDPALVEKLLTATENNKSLQINWQHNGTAKTHNFTVTSIEKGKRCATIAAKLEREVVKY